ncbi:coiled-coil domain-containing protein 33-like isoform X2 [Cavia porcellus]|uniref:coiled-coil domain-containing protein 33-like isoform X2 n=1 Tax=Cavia porcellus TaxID=10141 RepID=UPI002FE3DD01
MNNYWRAMQRMSPREQISLLEEENQILRHLLVEQELKGSRFTGPQDLAMSMRQKLQRLISVRVLKLRMQRMKNELIRKNERETKWLEQYQAQQPKAALRRFQVLLQKMKALEDPARHHEKVLEKMEQVLEDQLLQERKEHRAPQQAAGKAACRISWPVLQTSLTSWPRWSRRRAV